MASFARFFLVFSVVVWIGGIIFFSAVIAPALFATLSKPELAAEVVGVSLTALHLIGIGCGALFLAMTFLLPVRNAKAARSLVILMVALTAISQFVVLPQMRHIRDLIGGSIEALPAHDAGRAAFDRLHQFSVGLEGATLLAGLVVIAIIARQLGMTEATNRK